MPVTKKFIQRVTQITAANLNKTGFYNLVAREQASQDMTLAISDGVVMINGTIVKYAGGNTGSFTAPSTNPRIDLVTLDTSGAIGIIQGVEAASPVAPAYPIDKLVICEVYLRTSSTKIYQEDQTTDAYIKTESRHLSVENYRMRRFFGTGADGDVSITSGTTTLAADMNYNSLKISSGANLKTNGYRVFVLNELYNAGTIYSDGGAGGNAVMSPNVSTPSTPGTAGTATSAGTLSAGTAGVAGGQGDYSTNNAMSGSGGGSGASGGVILLFARVLTNTGTIRANGGAGGNGAQGRWQLGAAGSGGSAGTNGIAKTALGSNGVAGGAGGGATAGGGYAGGTAGTCTTETVAVNASLASSGNLTAGGSNTYSDILTYSVTASTNTTTLSCSAGSGGGGGGKANSSPEYHSGGGGGGGGGSGGVIILGYQSITLGTVQVNGGNGGTKGLGVNSTSETLDSGADGVNGTAGNAGKIYKLIVT